MDEKYAQDSLDSVLDLEEITQFSQKKAEIIKFKMETESLLKTIPELQTQEEPNGLTEDQKQKVEE